MAGNPAIIVRELNDSVERYTREDMFRDPVETMAYFRSLDETLLVDNSMWRWLLGLIIPRFRREQ